MLVEVDIITDALIGLLGRYLLNQAAFVKEEVAIEVFDPRVEEAGPAKKAALHQLFFKRLRAAICRTAKKVAESSGLRRIW